MHISRVQESSPKAFKIGSLWGAASGPPAGHCPWTPHHQKQNGACKKDIGKYSISGSISHSALHNYFCSLAIVLHVKLFFSTFIIANAKNNLFLLSLFRDDFKTQPPVDRQFCLVPAGFYRSKQWQLPGTGGQPVVGFWSRPLCSKQRWLKLLYNVYWNCCFFLILSLF